MLLGVCCLIAFGLLCLFGLFVCDVYLVRLLCLPCVLVFCLFDLFVLFGLVVVYLLAWLLCL